MNSLKIIYKLVKKLNSLFSYPKTYFKNLNIYILIKFIESKIKADLYRL